jgi:hypothetical protein
MPPLPDHWQSGSHCLRQKSPQVLGLHDGLKSLKSNGDALPGHCYGREEENENVFHGSDVVRVRDEIWMRVAMSCQCGQWPSFIKILNFI